MSLVLQYMIMNTAASPYGRLIAETVCRRSKGASRATLLLVLLGLFYRSTLLRKTAKTLQMQDTTESQETSATIKVNNTADIRNEVEEDRLR